MPQFTDYISDTLVRQGYKLLGKSDGDVFLLENEHYPGEKTERKSIWICYLEAEITPEQIRRMFEFKGHVLIVVNEKLIPENVASRQKTPMWLRVLHGLYMGRIYVWNGRSVFGLHIDYDTGDVSESAAIQPTALLLPETGTWLRGWTGVYKLARFYDTAWWTVGSQPPKADQDDAWTRGKKTAWEDAYQQAKNSSGPYQRTQNNNASGNSGYWKGQRQTYDDPWAKQAPPKQSSPPPKQENKMRDFRAEFKACGNAQDAKALYKRLAREFHPDMNPGMDTTVIMQQLNAAWDYMRDWWD
jgi:hypothetical protein